MSFSLDDYIDVAERVVHFRELYPDGTLQQVNWEIREIGNQRFVVYTAAAYRHPDDPRPGMGTAWEPFPGTTPYTRNSELMNAETAAWGRAIVALGLTSNRKLASRQEVKARREEQSAPKPKPAPAPPSDIPSDWPPKVGPAQPQVSEQTGSGPNSENQQWAADIANEFKARGMNVGDFRRILTDAGVTPPEDLRSLETRVGFLASLSIDQQNRVAQLLIEQSRTLEAAIEAGDVTTEAA